jgi:hypothetical protein
MLLQVLALALQPFLNGWPSGRPRSASGAYYSFFNFLTPAIPKRIETTLIFEKNRKLLQLKILKNPYL